LTAERVEAVGAVLIQSKAQRAKEAIMKSNRKPKQVKVKTLATKSPQSVKGGGLNYTKISW
jgi:hypothetical protein